MVTNAPEIYKKYVFVNRKCDLVLYVETLNSLYRIMKAALLLYIKYFENLKSIGCQLNTYDPCVANNILDGAQQTVVWHNNNLKVRHIDGGVVTRMAAWLKKSYERLFKEGSGAMTLNRGMIHEYLGMTLDYSTQREVKSRGKITSVTLLLTSKNMTRQTRTHTNLHQTTYSKSEMIKRNFLNH